MTIIIITITIIVTIIIIIRLHGAPGAGARRATTARRGPARARPTTGGSPSSQPAQRGEGATLEVFLSRG